MNLPLIRGREIKGEFTIEHSDIENLAVLAESNIIDNFAVVNNQDVEIAKLKGNELVTISLFSNKLNDGYYFEKIENLIQRFTMDLPDKKFYVFSENFNSLQNLKTKKIENYFKTIELITLLKEISQYTIGNELLFFKSNVLELPITYEEKDVIDSDNIQKLIDSLNSPTNMEERRIIFVNELSNSLLKIQEKSNRFKYFLINFNDIFDNFTKSFKLYLENFSYQKLKTEISNQLIEYSKKIHSVINDIQTKLITIPIAFLLIFNQFNFEGDKWYINMALVFGSIVYGYILDVLIKNQISLLNFIESDIQKYQMALLQNQSSILENEILELFKEIPSKVTTQLNYLNIFRAIIWLIPIISMIIFIFVSLTAEITFQCCRFNSVIALLLK